MLLAGDERRHNNPDLAYVDADFIRGGGRVTATPATLLTDFSNKLDQLKDNVTLVYVVSEDALYRLKSKANINSLIAGWKKETIDLTNLNVGYISAQTLNTNAFYLNNTRILNGTGNQTLNASSVANFEIDGSGVINITGVENAGANQIFFVSNKGAYDAIFKASSNLLLPFNADFTLSPGCSVIIKMSSISIARLLYSTNGYSSNDFTSELKTKLDSLTEHYKGKFTTLASLQAVPGTNGAYAYVDAGAGNDAIEYIWDATDNKWTPSSNTGASSFAQLTGLPTDNTTLAYALNGKVDKATGKDLSTNDYTSVEKAKLNSIVKDFDILFSSNQNTLRGVYFRNATQIKEVKLRNASSFSYSLNNGTSYFTPTLPLTPASYINIPADTYVNFRIAFNTNATDATATLLLA